jgi:CBS domain-containing protein
LASVGLAALFAVLAIATRGLAPAIVVETIEYLYYVNFLLAVFNLIPAFPLDGGRVLRSYLWHRSGNLRSATRIATSIGSMFAALLVGLGLFAILTFNIVPGIWLLLIGLFLKRSADSEYQAFELRSGLKDLTLQKIMSPPIAVRSSMPLSDFINDYVFRYHLRQFPVVDDGHFVGMIDVQSIKKIASSEWNEVRIGGHLLNPARYPVLNPDLEAAEVLRILVTGNHSAAPVVRDGELLGMITKDDLIRLISLKNDLAA